MDCQFTEQLSLLIDGELNDDEARQVRGHLSACAICQRAQEDFLLFRRKIQEYQPESDVNTQRQAMAQMLQTVRTPFWRKQIALPVPAFALLILAFVAVSVWAIASRLNLSPPPLVKTEPPIGKPDIQPPQKGFNLSKFDQGERAVIYTANRAQNSTVQQ
jgi:anti-sigma factor RsiW